MTDPNSNEQAENPVPSDTIESEQDLWPSPGQSVKTLRKELGYSREEVAQSLYITVHYVKALENDDYAKLPGQPFIKGYYKAYASFLGVDTDQVLKSYMKFVEHSVNQDMQEAQAVESRSRNKTIKWIVIVAVLLGLIGGASWMMSG